MSVDQEVYPIPGYEGIYGVTKEGAIWNVKRMKKKRVFTNYDGYRIVELHRNGKGKMVKLHRIIATVFIPNPNKLQTVNHKNGLKTDNRIENLEWMTFEDNIRHAHQTGLINQSGRCGHSSKLSHHQVIEIRKETMPSPKLAKVYNVSESTIRAIRQGRIWKHLITKP